MKNKNFFFAIYKDYAENNKIAQLADNIDCLSCEILARPGVIRIECHGIREAWKRAKTLALNLKCTHLENMADNYKIIKLKT